MVAPHFITTRLWSFLFTILFHYLFFATLSLTRNVYLYWFRSFFYHFITEKISTFNFNVVILAHLITLNLRAIGNKVWEGLCLWTYRHPDGRQSAENSLFFLKKSSLIYKVNLISHCLESVNKKNFLISTKFIWISTILLTNFKTANASKTRQCALT